MSVVALPPALYSEITFAAMGIHLRPGGKAQLRIDAETFVKRRLNFPQRLAAAEGCRPSHKIEFFLVFAAATSSWMVAALASCGSAAPSKYA